MRRSPRLAPQIAVAALTVASATPAEAAKRKVPFGFFGTVLVTPMSNAQLVPDAVLEQEMALIARPGVEAVRANFRWDEIEPAAGVYNWADCDRFVAAAARHRLLILANAWLSPAWASEQPSSVVPWRYPPTDPQLYAGFVRELAKRYGSRGSSWAENRAPRRSRMV